MAMAAKTVVPWRMCGTCHRRGSRWPHPRYGSKAHKPLPTGTCGQCGGKDRVLYECHEYDFRGVAVTMPQPEGG
jgi:hypothetical protein